jgi:dTMP kinase
MQGLFISFEGGEGVGKSTQIKALTHRLKSAGHRVLTTREPGGTPLCESIRSLVQSDQEVISPEAELLLFTASRAQLCRQIIQPAIKRGEIVLCDRFMDSTSVYQGVARAIPSALVDQINQFSVGNCKPDLTFLIDLDPHLGSQRVRQRAAGSLDRIEQESLDFFKAVRNGYLELASNEPDRFVILDGQLPIEVIEQTIWTALSTKLSSM